MTLLDLAREDLGRHEEPVGSNITQFGAEVGLTPAAWCCQWVSHVLRRAGFVFGDDAQHKGLGFSSVGFFMIWASNHGWAISPRENPCPGDLVIFRWQDGDTWPDHIGFDVDVYADGSLLTIEGNSASGLINGVAGVGDQVGYHHRPRNFEVAGFVRVPLPDSPPMVPASFTQPQTTPAARNVAPYPRLSNGVLLRQGSRGDYVALYQKRMADRGWHISVDGDFGPQTDSITRQFQTEKRLGTDGVVGPVTWKAAYELPVT